LGVAIATYTRMSPHTGIRLLSLLALAASLALASGCGGGGGGGDAAGGPPAEVAAVPATCGGAILSEECEVVERINAARAAQSPPLPPLTYQPELAVAAVTHNLWMIDHGCFAHVCEGEAGVGARITAAGYDYSSYGECIAAGYATPEAVVQGWLNSPGHRAILLGANVDVGVSLLPCESGCAYGTYWTAAFGTPR